MVQWTHANSGRTTPQACMIIACMARWKESLSLPHASDWSRFFMFLFSLSGFDLEEGFPARKKRWWFLSDPVDMHANFTLKKNLVGSWHGCIAFSFMHVLHACMVYAWSICMHVLTKKIWSAHTHAWRWSKGRTRTWSQINQAQNFPQEQKKLNGSRLLKGPWGLPSQNIHVKPCKACYVMHGKQAECIRQSL